MFRWHKSNVKTMVPALVLVGLMGCSTAKETAHDGAKAVDQRNWDAAVYHYLEAVAEDPGNVEYRMQLTRARQKASQAHLHKGLMLRDMGRLHDARNELRMATELDPVNQFAEQALERVVEELEVLAGPGGIQALAEMKKKAAEAKVRPPILDPTSDEPITLKFPQPKPIKEIYKALGKAYGFNVLFDPKLKDDKLSVELNDVTAERALEIVLQAGGHFYKVLDEHSIIVAEDSPQNRREYEDLVIKTFFLSNSEVKDIDKLLRALIEARRLATNEQLNAITLRDTADKVAIAEKLIKVNDKAKAEVLVDVELLLMSTNKTSDLGMTLSTYNFVLGVDTGLIPDKPEGGGLFLDQLNQITKGNTFVNIPSLVINLAKSSGKAEVLAQPQLRITDGEKAKLHIGDKYPIPVTSFNSGNNIGGNVVPITSFQYQDIGIRIEVEPRVHHNREITLKISVEISNIGDTVSVGPSQEAVVIGTRTITSVNRLKDGETSLLAGLFRTDSTEGVVETPGLSKIPWLGRLFTNKKRTLKRTDLVMTVTPHIVRFPDIDEEDLAPLWVGTESRISFYGSNSPRVASGSGSRSPFDARKSRAPDRERASGDSERGKEPKPRGFGIPQNIKPRQVPTPQGTELASGNKSLEVGDGDEGVFDEAFGLEEAAKPAEIDLASPPVQLNLQPSVISLAVDDTTQIQIVGSGDYDNYRLPVTLTFDPRRIAVESVEFSPAIGVIEQVVDSEQGLIELDLVVADGDVIPQVLATLVVRALTQGPAPLIFSSRGIVRVDGTTAPVWASDGAIFVTGGIED